MKVSPFTLYTNRKRLFSPGAVDNLSAEILFFGKKAAIFTGQTTLTRSATLKSVLDKCTESGIETVILTVDAEPSPEIVDKNTDLLKDKDIDVVVGIGGGSVMDTAKAVSAMLCESGSVKDFLEGIGEKDTSGKRKPLILVPTTAGTGSEATYNAVLSSVGEQGFKKSLRHTNYTADVALVDPLLFSSCPPSLAASSGLDALSQLIESYVSSKANFYTDFLVIGAIEGVLEALPVITADKSKEEFCDTLCLEAWAKMAYGAYISGISLANSGLAVIHGIAGPLGGLFKAPHGALCGTLLAEGIKKTIEKLEKTEPESPALLKFTKLGYIASKSDDMLPREARARLVQILEGMIENLKIPRLSEYGIEHKDIARIVAASSNKNNPVMLDDDDIAEIIKNRI